MSWLWSFIFVCLTLTIHFSEAKHHHKKFPVVVVGSVQCHICSHQEASSSLSHPIPGASVAVECQETPSTHSFLQQVKTDNNGEFKVHLPKHLKGCSVKLISSNNQFCSVPAQSISSSLKLKSKNHGTHIFSAGLLTFKPLKQPKLCNQISSIKDSNKQLNSLEKFFQFPNLPQFPNIPSLPDLPPFPGFPYSPPVSKEGTEKTPQSGGDKVMPTQFFPFPPNPLNPPSLFPPPSIFPPNPFQPPPSIIPPVFPSPPPSLFPPIFPSPPPQMFPPIFPSPPPQMFPPILPVPPVFHIPSIPGLVPSPPPPPPPIFPIPLPPFPFQPTPGFPGVPPAQVSSQSKPSSP